MRPRPTLGCSAVGERESFDTIGHLHALYCNQNVKYRLKDVE